MGSNREVLKSIAHILVVGQFGKPRKSNRRDDDKKNKRGRVTKKTPVVGIIDRTTKQVFARVALPNKEGKKLTGKHLLEIIDLACKSNATVISDEFKGFMESLAVRQATGFI